MSNENTSTWSKIKENVSTTFSAVSNWFAQTSVGEWIIDKYNDIFDKDDKESGKNGKTNESEGSKDSENPNAGKWTVWIAGAPVGGVLDTKEEAEQLRKDKYPTGTVRSWDEIYGKRVAEASDIVASDGTSNEATAEMD